MTVEILQGLEAGLWYKGFSLSAFGLVVVGEFQRGLLGIETSGGFDAGLVLGCKLQPEMSGDATGDGFDCARWTV